MIHFEVIQSPDSNVLETFKFAHNQLYLGRSRGNLVIRDPELLPNHLMIEVIGTELLVHPQKDVPFYLIDGKRATNIRKVKKGCVLTFAQTRLRILDWSETPFPTKKEILNHKLGALVTAQSPRLATVEALTQIMKTDV